MTKSIITRLNMDFQDVKDYRMELKFTDKIERLSRELINLYSNSSILETDFLFENINPCDLCDFAALLFERDREDMLFIYDNNDIHGLYEASLLTIKAKGDKELIEASVAFKKVLLSHYLPEIKAFISYYNDEYFSSYLSDHRLTSYQDKFNGEISYSNQFGRRVSISY